MYDLSDARARSAILQLLAALMRHSVIWPAAASIGVALLFGMMAALVGVSPLAFTVDFLGESVGALFGLTVHLWVLIFFIAALCFGVGRSLPQLLLHRPLNGGGIARFAKAVGPWATPRDGLLPHCANACIWQALTHPSRNARNTASDLAGSSPRLE